MLTHPLMEQLRQLRCVGMSEAFHEQLNQIDCHELSFEERLSLLVERELMLRETRQLKSRLTHAQLKQKACLMDIDYQASRGLAKNTIQSFSTCQFIAKKQNILITGCTGTGKTFLACALGHQACLEGFRVKYWRLPRLLQAMNIARGDGSYSKFLLQLAKTDFVILDDWGLEPLTAQTRRDLLEVLDDRHNQSATCITSQLPIKHWHETIGDPTLADAILDRVIHNAHKVELKGESLRKKINALDP